MAYVLPQVLQSMVDHEANGNVVRQCDVPGVVAGYTMKEETGETYQSSLYAKLLCVADAKVGKSTSLVAGCMGVLPWQTAGAVVDKPEHLHIITTDSNALGHIKKFITETCKANAAALGFRVYNMQDDYVRAFHSTDEYDGTFFNTLTSTIAKIQTRARVEGGVHALILSSVTTMGRAILREIAGPLGDKKSNMNKSKWPLFNGKLNELQAHGQGLGYHCIWEGHLAKKFDFSNKDDDGKPEEKDSIQLQGSVGASWAANVEQVVTMERSFGQAHPGTKCDKTAYNTRPSLNMVASGRGFTELLNPKEPCITTMFEKLGLKVGKWKPNV